ncbi:xin actin-binding repeat-containing protein 1 isoform X2 [Nelusetta ayraudi]
MSKVTPQEAADTNTKAVREPSPERRRSVKAAKMAEDSEQGRGDLKPPPSAEEHEDTSAGLSREKLYQRRQKCELRRLLKHTHPELKKLDDVMNEELAEVFGSETRVPAGESGYEGEVFSRRLIFESCSPSNAASPYAPKRNAGKEKAPRGDSTAAVEESVETPCQESVKQVRPDDKTAAPDTDCEEEEEEERIIVDVKATRRIFEDQSRFNSDKLQRNDSELGHKLNKNLPTVSKSNAVNKVFVQSKKEEPNAQNSDQDITRVGDGPTTETVPEDETSSFPDRDIKTSAALFQNNPFISANMERENYSSKSRVLAGDGGEAQDHPATNVKSRAHLFESMPFDRIRRQNKDEVEAMVENIKETLESLYRANVIHSAGSIVEVNETMIAKRAKFTLSELGPELDYDEVAEGGAQNLVLQLLPRANLKPEIMYLKEDGSGRTTATKIPVQVHQRQDAEFKTANVIQVVEDILNQDNSLRKGVVIQRKADTCSEVIVYSLYKYFNEDDVKSYRPPQTVECNESELQGGEGKADTLIKRCPEDVLEDQTRGGAMGDPANVEVKGNIKLWNFWNCIEKGDMESLRSVQAETKILEQEAGMNQSAPECSVTKQQPEDLLMEREGSCKHIKEQPYMHMNTQDSEVLKAELVEVVDDVDEISSLQSAIETLQRATLEAKALSKTAKQRQKVHVEGPAKEPTGLIVTNSIHTPKTDAKQESEDGKADPNKTQRETELPASQISDQKLDRQLEETCHHVSHPEEAQTAETSSKQTQKDPEVAQKPDTEAEHSTDTAAAQQEGEEVVLRGTFAAALNSLERSNINVTRGDFRAAMIYRNSSYAHKGRSKNADVPVQEASKKEPCSFTEPVENGEKLSEEVSEGSAAPQSQSMTVKVDAGAETGRRRVGPKPAIPPKPDHLKAKKRDVQSTGKSYPQAAQTSTSKLDDNKEPETDDLKTRETCEKPGPVSPEKHQDQSSVVSSERKDTDENISLATVEIKLQDLVGNKPVVVSRQECKRIGGEKQFLPKTPPVKPKRVRIAQTDNQNPKQSPVIAEVVEEPAGPPGASESGDTKGRKDEGRVKMRGRSRRVETEDERRQRLSVHMDEIMKDNVSTAMEIFDNLRRQEELKGILSRVEEIEQDTSDVDVGSLKGAFENVGSSGGEQRMEAKRKEEVKETAVNKSSMAHVFGDLERASEEIMNLKEQTLARLLDIEGAIKKALYSVSTLKSESDIAGLSCLFKESMGAVATSANISKISIGSSRSRAPQVSGAQGAAVPAANHQGMSPAAKQRGSPPSSPAFISIQSAAKKCSGAEGPPLAANFCTTCQQSPMTEKKFRTSKTLACNSPAQDRKKDPGKGGQKQPAHNNHNNPKRELSVLEVQTDVDGNGFTGAKTVRENYERTDNLGNRFYSSKTVITTQAETATPAGQAVMSVAPFQVTEYPEVRLPIHRKS